MKKKLAIMLIAISLFSSFYVSAAAVELASEDPANAEERAEEVMWFYRNYNGRLQKRLWSVTYGKWLTDWEYC
ncbi:hypothetical protein DW094_05745 [Ruminococcaceae bacterium AM07-15]|nr:hypothetical protein DW094_05745 [Ruminococcaceae bacterium AM07-15]